MVPTGLANRDVKRVEGKWIGGISEEEEKVQRREMSDRRKKEKIRRVKRGQSEGWRVRMKERGKKKCMDKRWEWSERRKKENKRRVKGGQREG